MSREPIERTRKRWKLEVPAANLLDTTAKRQLADIAHEQARAVRAAREAHPPAEVERQAQGFDASELLPPPRPSSPLTPNAPQLDVDVIKLSFENLLGWAAVTDLQQVQAPAVSRSTYVLAAEHLFFRELITEHDAAKAVVLLLLAGEYGKAGSIFLYSLESLGVSTVHRCSI